MTTRPRLDRALVAAGLAPSRSRAQALIAEGHVRIDGVPVTRASLAVEPGATLEVVGPPDPWVSRGARKLVHALEVFGLDPKDAVALDLGASTGGFTQVLLRAGAAAVWAVDVGHGQLDPTLRADPRVRLIEGLNARDLGADHIPPPDWITADLSFISLAKALPPALGLARPGAVLVALIKPQFEVGPVFVGKGGIVRDAAAIARARAEVAEFLAAEGWRVIGEAQSPITGGDGNVEYLIGAVKDPA